MKNYLLTLFICIFISCGGSKSETPTPEKPTINNPPKNFKVSVGNIKNTKATITWTNAIDPDGDKVSYTLTQGNLEVKNILNNSYQITNLNKNTFYKGNITASDHKGGTNKQTFTYTTTNITESSENEKSFNIPNNISAYYKNVNFKKSGLALKEELAILTIEKHTNHLSYSQVREALKITDLVPNSSTHVYLLYGFSNNTCSNNKANDNDHKTRNKNSFGGGSTCQWNREHTYPKSLGTPNLGKVDAGADAHHLRACDVQRNGNRSNKKFASGLGNSKRINGGWYPGDEWKGDVARMLMYMYLRYGNQCLPKNVVIGKTNSTDSNMIDLLLKWNADDPVSAYEINRNNYLENSANKYYQGNRNPFIDNPYLATKIWGGKTAQNKWE